MGAEIVTAVAKLGGSLESCAGNNGGFRGRFITVEGIDGAGKSSQIDTICAWLEAQGRILERTREPGGTPLGEALRDLLLHQPMQMETEAMLMFAARREHLECRIWPALAAGRWVVCDRFSDASFAYQVGGRGLSAQRFDALEAHTHPGFQPDLTLLFDLSPQVAAQRLAKGRERADRFESENLEFFTRVRAAYLQRAQAYPQRIAVIAADGDVDQVRKALEAELRERFPQ